MAQKRLILTDTQLAFLKQLEKHDRIVVLTAHNFYWPGNSDQRLGKRVDGRTVYAAIRRRWVHHPDMKKLFKRGVDFKLTKTAAALAALDRVRAGYNVEVQKKSVT